MTAVDAQAPVFDAHYVLDVEVDGKQSLSWFLEVVTSLRNLFTFLVGTGIYLLDITAWPSDIEPADNAPFRIYIPEPVPRVARLDTHYYSTHYRTHSAEIPQVVAKWFSHMNQLHVAQSTYAELLRSDGMTGEAILLRTMQALEHLHGVIWSDESRYVEGKTYRNLCKWLREQWPGSLPHVTRNEMTKLELHKDTILSRFGQLKNLSFRSRIQKAFDSIPLSTLMPLVDNPADPGRFLEPYMKRLEATRHYLTHYDEKQRRHALAGKEIETAAFRCWGVLTYWIAQILGFSSTHSRDIALQATKALFLVSPDFRPEEPPASGPRVTW